MGDVSVRPYGTVKANNDDTLGSLEIDNGASPFTITRFEGFLNNTRQETVVAKVENYLYGKRIVAAVNAVKGIPTEALEKGLLADTLALVRRVANGRASELERRDLFENLQELFPLA